MNTDDDAGSEIARSRFRIVEERSTVLIGARSTMGPIGFESRAVCGEIRARIVDGEVDHKCKPSASLDVGLQDLRSGNELYDAELRRRIEVAVHPTCHLELIETELLGDRRYALAGDLTFHDTTRPVEGSVEVEAPNDRTLLVVGEKTIDIRDFDIAAPSILMLKIYPDVRVQMFLEATIDEDQP